MRYVVEDNRAALLLVLGLALGVAADILLWSGGLAGLGFTAWVALCGLASLSINLLAPASWRAVLLRWFGVATGAMCIPVFRASGEFILLSFLLLMLSAVVVLVQARGTSLMCAKIADYNRAFWRLPISVITGSFPWIAQVQWRGMTTSRRLFGIIKGLLLAAPLLFVFIALFSSADINFERYASHIASAIAFAGPEHLFFIAVMAWITTGLLSCTMPNEDRPPTPNSKSVFSLGSEETIIVMGSLAALFIAFIVLQASYLFGGYGMVEGTSDFTFASYARRGFFELVVVSALTLVLLLGLAAARSPLRFYRSLALVLIACVFIMLASALHRLSLYVDVYGLSMSRVFAFAFMFWLTGNLLSFAATCLRGQAEGFASGLIISGVAVGFVLALLNPAAVVVQVNIDRASQHEREVDWQYLFNLGPDAVPLLVENLAKLNPSVQSQVATALMMRYVEQVDTRQNDWRTFNFSHAKARSAVISKVKELD